MTREPRFTLSWRLCTAISSVVVAVMVAVSLPTQLHHRKQMDARTGMWLRALATPISQVLEEGDLGPAFEASIQDFRVATASVLGYLPQVRVESASNVDTYGEERRTGREPFVVAEARAPGGDPLRVLVEFEDYRQGGGLAAYWWHVFATAVALSASLYFTLRWLIARPIERLLDGVRLMEMGYWGEAPQISGVWEIRWLARRFQEMGHQLERTVKNLAAAERRGASSGESAESTTGAEPFVMVGGPEASSGDTSRVRSGLVARLEMLESMRADDPGAADLAAQMLERDPALAEQIGEIDLKTRIEDRAFAILDPQRFQRLRREVGEMVPRLLRDADLAESTLLRALAEMGVTVVHTERRIKGLGSIWRKMREKRLRLSQIHDLIALRVVVATSEDCYRTLHAVHGEFEPIVGRFKDYIADPKPNGYQSMHSSVRLPSGAICEIQIRSQRMHLVAERGDCAHWRYRLGVGTSTSGAAAEDG